MALARPGPANPTFTRVRINKGAGVLYDDNGCFRPKSTEEILINNRRVMALGRSERQNPVFKFVSFSSRRDMAQMEAFH
jgi:hypothetical protein